MKYDIAANSQLYPTKINEHNIDETAPRVKASVNKNDGIRVEIKNVSGIIISDSVIVNEISRAENNK